MVGSLFSFPREHGAGGSMAITCWVRSDGLHGATVASLLAG